MILLSLVRVRAAFRERKLRSDKYVRKLKDRHGIDKHPVKIFEQNELAKQNLSNRFRNDEKIEKIIKMNPAKLDLEIETNSIAPSIRQQVSPRNQLVNRLQNNQTQKKNQYVNRDEQMRLMNQPHLNGNKFPNQTEI